MENFTDEFNSWFFQAPMLSFLLYSVYLSLSYSILQGSPSALPLQIHLEL